MSTDIPNNRVNDVVSNFRAWLITGWTALDAIMNSHDWDNDPYFIDDWLQTNWEYLVCRQLTGAGTMQKFGDRPIDALKTESPWILRVGNENGPVFLSLVGKNDDAFGLFPNFDYVKVALNTGTYDFLPIQGLNFTLVPN